jgi:Tfp pilus assembly protein FimT
MRKQEGASLLELLCVLAIMLVLMAFSVPSFAQWRDNGHYRSAARELASSIRESRMRAIKSNLEHRIEIDISNGRYRLTHGNRAANSTASSWGNNVIRDWTLLPQVVQLRANADCSVTQGTVFLHFNPYGSSNTRYVCVFDQHNMRRFQVGVGFAATGRVVVR